MPIPSSSALPTGRGRNPVLPQPQVQRTAALATRRSPIMEAVNYWASKAVDGEGEMRDIAANRIQHCLETGGERLDLGQLNLTKLPDMLPSTVTKLRVSHNKLRYLPYFLPPALTDLMADHNRIEMIDIKLPRTLEYLDISHNRLLYFPREELFDETPCYVLIENNPDIHRASLPNDGTQPLDIPRLIIPAPTTAADKLALAVISWFPSAIRATTWSDWRSFAREDHASDFCDFLNRLRASPLTGKSLSFIKQVRPWLTTLEHTPSLRHQSFSLAHEATSSCDDRVALTWNQMQQAALLHRVEQGEFDADLPGLVAQARQAFRIEQLEQVAREKVKQLKRANASVDEIEVWLAFQVKLREPLALQGSVDSMRYLFSSGVTQDDLDLAMVLVKTREDSDFPDWLAQWAPWKDVLARIERGRTQGSRQRLDAALVTEFPLRVKIALDRSGLAGISDAEAAVGRDAMQLIQRRLDRQLTQSVLRVRQQAHLLNPHWYPGSP